MRVGIVVPHIFMQQALLPQVIFSPGRLALELAAGLQEQGVDVTLFTPGPVETSVRNHTADMSYFEAELARRGDSTIDLLKKHPLTYITLARQVQSELIAAAYAAANTGELDIVHIYTNEEDTALPFAQFCVKPVLFTHHDPFNFLVGYKAVFPKYKQLPWISMSYAQRHTMPEDTNWCANIYHGVPSEAFQADNPHPTKRYLAYMGRIIEPKGVHLAIAAVRSYNAAHPDTPYKLKIAGKHYASSQKDTYWQTRIAPSLDADISYVGYLRTPESKQAFLGQATALLVPSLFDEPFGLVMAEALACGTPLIGLDSGAIPEVIRPGETGLIVNKVLKPSVAPAGPPVIDEAATGDKLAAAIAGITDIDRGRCRQDFEARFTTERMCAEHLAAYNAALLTPITI